MFDPAPFTLLIVILTGYIILTKAEVPSCFYPDGSRADGDYACNLTAEASFCCAVGYSCLDNKICIGSGDGVQPYNRGSCTDQTWRSPDCPQFCQDFTPGGGSWLVNCDRWADDKGVCCYDGLASQPLDCCTNSSAEVLLLDGSADAFYSISSGAATQTRITSSSTTTTATTATPERTSSSPVNNSPSPTPPPPASPPNSLSTGAYVGIAIGAASAVALLCAALYLLHKRRRSKQQINELAPFVAPAWKRPGSSHSRKEGLGNMYGHRSIEVATLNELPAENQTSELEAETLLELEGVSRMRK